MKSNVTVLNANEAASRSKSRYARKKVVAIEAAASVFAEKGFHGATTNDIAKAMGIQQGSLYYYFKSKEQALQLVCEYGFTNYVERMQTICAKEQGFEAKILSIITSHLSSYRQKNNAMKVHNDQRLYLPKEERATLKNLGTEYRRLLEQVLQEGIKRDELRVDLDTHFIAYSLIGLCNSWGSMLVRDEAIDLFETIQHCADFAMTGILRR